MKPPRYGAFALQLPACAPSGDPAVTTSGSTANTCAAREPVTLPIDSFVVEAGKTLGHSLRARLQPGDR